MNTFTSVSLCALVVLLASAQGLHSMHQLKHARHEAVHFVKHHPLAALSAAVLVTIGGVAYKQRKALKEYRENYDGDLTLAGKQFRAKHPVIANGSLLLAGIGAGVTAVKTGLWYGAVDFVKHHKLGSAVAAVALATLYAGDRRGYFEGLKVRLKLKKPATGSSTPGKPSTHPTASVPGSSQNPVPQGTPAPENLATSSVNISGQ